MSYTVIARKWRPQSFADVVGQRTITLTLQNAIRSNRVAHAFIFSGSRGVGKTTTARILARALNCHHGPTAEPCGECVSCREIAAGNSLDVQEIDAASNTGVDNIRELRETIQYRPARDRFKIFIIDEVHMLSNAAFNALLKTLEEPPEHVKFIMATTEPHRVPATILSRCQQFEFKMIPYQQILERLRLIAQSEGIEISDHALRLVCSASEGSMRDAQSALDQVLAFSGKEVRDEDVRALLGVIAEDLLNALVDALIRHDRRALLGQLHQIAGYGHDLRVLCRKLLEHFRHLLVVKVSGFQPDIVPVIASQAELLKQQSESFSEMDLLRAYELLFRAEGELRWHPYPLFHLEVTLLKILQLPHLEEIEKVLSRLNSRGGTNLSGSIAPGSGAALKRPAALPKQPLKEVADWNTSQGEARELAAPAAEGDPQIGTLREVIHQERPSLAACLEKAVIQKSEGKLLIRFTEKQKFSKQLAEEASNFEFLKTRCQKIFGAPCRVELEIDTPQETQAAAEKTHRALQDPRVQLFTEAFPGKISIEDLDEP